MSRPLALWLASAVSAAAQTAPPVPAETPAISPAPRAVSSATAELLKAALPKLAPVKPAEKKPATESPDLRELDKPRNEIVRLPKYIVREPKPPVFTDRELYGEKAFGERLARRYYPDWYLAFNRLALYTPLALYMWPAADSALARFEDEERLRKKAEFEGLANLVMLSDPKAGAKAKDVTRDTFMRWTDFGWQGGDPK